MGIALGAWATKLFRYDRLALVLALEQRTYLTLVFPLAPHSQFRTNFASALEWALCDLGVAGGTARHEAAIIDFLPLTRLTARSMSGSLNELEFLAHCELDYTEDLRRVQRNLNDVPHVKRQPCTAVESVAEVFRIGSPRTAAFPIQ